MKDRQCITIAVSRAGKPMQQLWPDLRRSDVLLAGGTQVGCWDQQILVKGLMDQIIKIDGKFVR